MKTICLFHLTPIKAQQIWAREHEHKITVNSVFYTFAHISISMTDIKNICTCSSSIDWMYSETCDHAILPSLLMSLVSRASGDIQILIQKYISVFVGRHSAGGGRFYIYTVMQLLFKVCFVWSNDHIQALPVIWFKLLSSFLLFPIEEANFYFNYYMIETIFEYLTAGCLHFLGK